MMSDTNLECGYQIRGKWFVNIPAESLEDAKRIAEREFGAMLWDIRENGVLKAYPYNELENAVKIIKPSVG